MKVFHLKSAARLLPPHGTELNHFTHLVYKLTSKDEKAAKYSATY